MGKRRIGEAVQVKQLTLIWFDPLLNDAQDLGAQRYIQDVQYHLKGYGLTFAPCADPDAVYRQVAALATKSSVKGLSPLVLLNANFAQNCMVAQYLRVVAPGACIVLRTPNYTEQTLMRALQSGADGYFSGEVSPHFLSTLLFSRMRSGTCNAVSPEHVEAKAQPPHGWSLVEQAWAIVSPEGTYIRLTSTERAFLMALSNQPEMSAAHRVLGISGQRDR